jgi:predicted DNA-binding protein with PD1-like motif
MSNCRRFVALSACLIVTALVLGLEPRTSAQQPAAPRPTAAPAPEVQTPEGYVARGMRPEPNLAPGMRVTELGKPVRTYRVNMTKGDDILSGLTEFAEKYNIRNGYFSAIGAIDKALFGWTEIGRAADGTNLQKRIELNQEAEIVSLLGSISRNAQGQGVVHAHGVVSLPDGSVRGGHWWQARVSITAIIFVTETEGPPQPAQ